MDPKSMLETIAQQTGGKITEVGVLPDGSGFATMAMPLPKDHWLTAEGYNVPPMPFRCGLGETRSRMAGEIQAAARYAARASTMNGKAMDFDPDALVQNMIVGMLGYWTADGFSSEPMDSPPSPSPETAAPEETSEGAPCPGCGERHGWRCDDGRERRCRACGTVIPDTAPAPSEGTAVGMPEEIVRLIEEHETAAIDFGECPQPEDDLPAFRAAEDKCDAARAALESAILRHLAPSPSPREEALREALADLSRAGTTGQGWKQADAKARALLASSPEDGEVSRGPAPGAKEGGR